MVFTRSQLFYVGMALMVTSGVSAKKDEKHNVVSITTVEEHDALRKGTKPLITMHTASWCGPCKRTKPHYKDLSNEYDNVSFCMVDADNKELKGINAGVKGQSIPAFIFSHNGEVVHCKIGGMTPTQLKAEIDSFVEKTLGIAAPKKEKKPLRSPAEYYKNGQEFARKQVAVYSKKDFTEADLAAVMADETMVEDYALLTDASASKEDQQQVFERYKSYLRGYIKVLKVYKPQNANPQDAMVRYIMNTSKFALSAPDYAAIVANQKKQQEALMKRMKEEMWVWMAEISSS